MAQDPLLTTLLDLDAALASAKPLIVGGGYGLYLKQLYLQENPQIRTLFPGAALPTARSTEDIDLILRAEIVTDSPSMGRIRDALDRLQFNVVDTAKYTQFIRSLPIGSVKVDLLAGPLGAFAGRVPKDSRRVKPQPSVKLHASKLEEALAVDRDAISITITGQRSSGDIHRAIVLIPQGFSYLLMKLFAFRDRLDDAKRSFAQHHALDIYRIVAMLTSDEYANAQRRCAEYADNAKLKEAREIAQRYFVDDGGIGRLRIREHPLFNPGFDLTLFAAELGRLLLNRDA